MLAGSKAALSKAYPGYENFYQTSRMPGYIMLGVFGEVDGAHESVLKQ